MSDMPKRERKQAELYKAAAPTQTTKQVTIQSGKGIQLSEYPFFMKGLDKIKADDEVVKSLHLLLFAAPGKKVELKKNIRLFSGYDEVSTKDERHVKVTENKKKWTTQLLKSTLSLFGLEKSGIRSDLIERLLDYLLLPKVIKDAAASAEQNKKLTKPVPSKGTKRKAKGDGNALKKIHSPTGYMLFCGEARPALKIEQPDATFAELAVLLGQRWKLADITTKKKWNDLAAEKAILLKSNRGETEEEVNEEEDDDEEKDEDDVDEFDEKDDTAENKEEGEEERDEVGEGNDDVARMGAGDFVKLGEEEMKTPEEVENGDVPLE